jgi:hypothetical protein
MMKNRIFFTRLFAIALIALTAGCVDLDLTSDGRLSLEEIFSEYNRTKNYYDRCYDYLLQQQPGFTAGAGLYSNGSETYYTGGVMLASLCDEAQDASDGISGVANSWYSGTTSAFSNPLDLWGFYFEGIRKCNTFLQCIDDPEIATVKLDEVQRAGWIAEVRTLRAYYYLQIIKRYGGAPIMDAPYEVDYDFSQDTRASFEQCVDFIIADCDSALAVPVRDDKPDVGFRWKVKDTETKLVTRGFACAVKSQAALYAASPLWSTQGSKYTWARAAEITREALDDCLAHDYRLYDVEPPASSARDAYDYYHNVLVPDAARAIDKETIYRATRQMSVWRDAALPIFQDRGAEKAGPSPSQELVDAYEMQASGQIPVIGYSDANHLQPIINTLATDYNPDRPYEGRDPRFYASIYYNGASSALGGGTIQKDIFPIYFMKDYHNLPGSPDGSEPATVDGYWENVADENGDSVAYFNARSNWCIHTTCIGDTLPVRQKRLFTFEYKLTNRIEDARFYYCTYSRGGVGQARPGLFEQFIALEPATEWTRFEWDLEKAISTWGFGVNSDYGDTYEDDGAYPEDHRIRFDFNTRTEITIRKMQIECYDIPVESQPVETFAGGTSGISSLASDVRFTRTGYYLRKFFNFKSTHDNPQDGYMRIFRLGELYLNYAEAAAEAGNDAAARDAANTIRRRAGMPDLPATLVGNDLVSRIRNERRIELAFEEHRFFDVRRWQSPSGNLDATDRTVTGTRIERLISNSDTTFITTRFSIPRNTYANKYLMLPLPQSEVAKMQSYTGTNWQNPGW